MKLVLAWIEIHRDDLVADWELAVNGQQPFDLDVRSLGVHRVIAVVGNRE